MLNLPGRAFFDATATLDAIHNSLAVIEFNVDGVVLSANANFCNAMGYAAAEIIGQKHSMFVDREYARSAEYTEFWKKLGLGEFVAQEFVRYGKSGAEVWIQGSYNPVRNARGVVTKVVKVATVITEEKKRHLEYSRKIDAVYRAQAVIEFLPDGQIITANENFLGALGYSLAEIQGKNHRIFVESDFAQSHEYEEFWQKLRRGEFVAAEFKRIGKGGREVWIQASYNPIFDGHGRVVKVVKFATDVTGRVRAVDAIAAGLEQVARNNLTHRIAQLPDPSFEKLRGDFNSAVNALDETLGAVAASSISVGGGASEIAAASDDLSRRTEQQAASLEQTAAALDEITATVRRSADGAKEASVAASAARTDAHKSGEVVREAVDAMEEIEKSAQQITQIIGVIDEIAFQTNLLALNAGVEAARAGDAGRGFAVVASEVRALAQRSAQAAKEIKTLIATSTNQVGRGVKLVGDTGDALAGIVSKVAQIDGLIAGIALSSQEQATGLGQVNTAVNQMDQVTQQNAAMVEEATAAAANLRAESQELTRLIQRFQTSQSVAKRSARPELVRSQVTRASDSPARRQQASLALAVAETSEWNEF